MKSSRRSFLRDYKPETVILMNSIYTAEVQGKLNELGLQADVVPL